MKKWIAAILITIVLAALTIAPFVDERFADTAGGLTYGEMLERAEQLKAYYDEK